MDSTGGNFEGLSRLLAQESSASDLLALLIELDPSSVSSALDLDPDGVYVGVREYATGRGRIDLLVQEHSSGSPAAVVELKGASSIHGDQLDRYALWASKFDPRPELIHCAFDVEESEANEDWTTLRLRDVFGAWERSNSPEARWLASGITAILDTWSVEADELPATRKGYYSPDITSKRIAIGLNARLSLEFGDGSCAEPDRDMAGSPMLIAWTPYPGQTGEDEVWLGVDLRSETRRSMSSVWSFRPFIQVLRNDDRPLSEDRRSAFDRAVGIREALRCSTIQQMLKSQGLGDLSESLSGGRFDGFKSDIDAFDFENHSALIGNSDRYPGAGPFGYDWGRRLASILSLDTAGLNREQVQELVFRVVSHLREAARNQLDTH